MLVRSLPALRVVEAYSTEKGRFFGDVAVYPALFASATFPLETARNLSDVLYRELNLWDHVGCRTWYLLKGPLRRMPSADLLDQHSITIFVVHVVPIKTFVSDLFNNVYRP
jgi:hypothetical protein